MRDALPDARGRASLTIVCIGNRWRSDDGAGLEVARLLQGTLAEGVELHVREGEPTRLIDNLDRADALWLVDAVSSGAPAGTIHRLDGEYRLPTEMFHTSTHHVGLGETVELARTLGRLPKRTVVFGIEGASFEIGGELTPAIAAAAERAADAVRAEVHAALDQR